MLQRTYKIPPHLQQCISADQAFHYRIVPVAMDDNGLVLKTDRDGLQELLSELNIVLGSKVILEPCGNEELQQYLTTNYRRGKGREASNFAYTNDFLERILYEAKAIGSSDIHFEPYEHKCRVRLRLDGKLMEYYSIPLQDYPTMVNKIKIRANLDISEKRLPQDGRISINSEGEGFDIRVSSLPTLHGEKLVLRILGRDTGSIDLEELGLDPTELERYREGIKKPNGIVLISGPTGSGKTTTLYATLKQLNDGTNNILTIEDPIEYTLEGVNQVQLKESIGLDFANALRTFLRQDPNIVMVGEIRDVKTANMAIRAALTGHLVLSTIHTNSAWATVSRLIDMGVPAFLIAGTLNMSVAQRLVRKLCNDCKRREEMDPDVLAFLPIAPRSLDHHFVAVGCNQCHHTGYKGRRAIYEILPISRDLAPSIKNNELQIDKYLEDNGIPTLQSNAMELIRQGVTSIEEVYALLSH